MHPAANAGPILRVSIAHGKFHGVIRPHTPTASFKAMQVPRGAGEEEEDPSSLLVLCVVEMKGEG